MVLQMQHRSKMRLGPRWTSMLKDLGPFLEAFLKCVSPTSFFSPPFFFNSFWKLPTIHTFQRKRKRKRQLTRKAETRVKDKSRAKAKAETKAKLEAKPKAKARAKSNQKRNPNQNVNLS